MKKTPWEPTDLQQVFPEMPESCSRAMLSTLGSLKEEKDMKVRLRFAVALVLAIVCLAGIALAVFQPQITQFFGEHYGEDFKAWMEKGDIAIPEDSIHMDGVTFTLNEVMLRNHGLYAMGTITPDEGTLLLTDEYSVNEPYGYASRHGFGEEAPEGAITIWEKAQQEGSAIKQVSVSLEKIGVDDGALLTPISWGGDAIPQKDGSIQFLFEVEDGVVVSAGKQYTIVMTAYAYPVLADGQVDYQNPQTQAWSVTVEPTSYAEMVGEAPQNTDAVPSTDEAVPMAPISDGTTAEMEIIVPDAYRQNGTLPVYAAIQRNFGKIVQPEWFNQSGIASENRKEDKGRGSIDFTDEGQLSWGSPSVYYNTFDGTCEAEYTYDDGEVFYDTIKRASMASEASHLAGWMQHGFPGTNEVYHLEKTQLTHISLAEAKAVADDMFKKLGMEGYTCTFEIDMGLDRIQTMGGLMNQAIDSGEMCVNTPKYDYATATVDDEGYYLVYNKYGTDGDLAGQAQATFYVTHKGIMYMSVYESYQQGEELYTPETLITAEEAAALLPKAIADSRWQEEVYQIKRATLTWMPTRGEGAHDMVMTPVWMLGYTTTVSHQEGYECWAAFNAIDGTLVSAIFN